MHTVRLRNPMVKCWRNLCQRADLPFYVVQLANMSDTDIPDANARAHGAGLRDGRVLLVGNQIASQLDKGFFLDRDPLTLAVSPDGRYFTKVYALRTSRGAALKHRFPGIPGRNPGYGYPSMIIHDGMLYVLYSINKEDMAITIVPLDSVTTPTSHP